MTASATAPTVSISRPASPAPVAVSLTPRDVVDDPVRDDRTFVAGDRIVGSYTVVRPLGQGGMGAVYLAVDDVSGQQVAVKVLPASLARERDIRERFVREARALAALDHPGIVPLISFTQEGDDRYLVMKYVGGRSLDAILGHDLVIEPDRARAIVREIAAALAFAHDRGVVHRDIKPANILIDDAGRVVIVDFGIARTLDGGRRVTETGMLMGTPQYMSPEQIVGATVDGRADLYACGLVLFEMLTGAPPFDGERTFDILRSHVDDAVPDVDDRRRAFVPDSPPVPPDLRRLLQALLEKDPARRPATAHDVVAIIDGQQVLAPSLAPAPTSAPAPRGRSANETPPQAFPDFDDDEIVRPRGPRRLVAGALMTGIAAAVGIGALWQGAGDAEVRAETVVDAGRDTRFEEAVLLARARVALDQGRLDDARVALETAVHLGASASPAVRLTRAELADRLGQPDVATRMLLDVDVAELDPESRDRHGILDAALRAPVAAAPPPAAPPPAPSTPAPSTPAPSTRATSPATTPPPPLTTTTPRPSALDDDILAGITDSTRDTVAACYRDHILSTRADVDDEDAPAGELRYRVDIAHDGTVSVARLTHATLDDPAFQACVASAVRRWRFPPFDGKDGGGGDDTIFHTFSFRARR